LDGFDAIGDGVDGGMGGDIGEVGGAALVEGAKGGDGGFKVWVEGGVDEVAEGNAEAAGDEGRGEGRIEVEFEQGVQIKGKWPVDVCILNGFHSRYSTSVCDAVNTNFGICEDFTQSKEGRVCLTQAERAGAHGRTSGA
jgi:hypothetical protein